MTDDKNVESAIRQIVKLGNTLKKIKGGVFPTDLLSTYGELKTCLELRRRYSTEVLQFKGKARADILLGTLNIEVKTSNIKKEDYGEGYGFALHIKECRQHPNNHFDHRKRGEIKGDFCYLDYLVCLAVNVNNMFNCDYYIFSRDELEKMATQIENRSTRFWFAPYRILIPIKPDPRQCGIIYNDFDLNLRKDPRFKNNWSKIKQ